MKVGKAAIARRCANYMAALVSLQLLLSHTVLEVRGVYFYQHTLGAIL